MQFKYSFTIYKAPDTYKSSIFNRLSFVLLVPRNGALYQLRVIENALRD